MVAALLIVDGASEPLGAGPTSLDRARTPQLDRLARAGRLSRLRTVAPGLVPGSETAIPALLGWTPTGPVDRGAIEAAARGIALAAGERAWRVDVRDGERRAGAAATRRAAVALHARAPRHALHALEGHRLLLVGGELPSLDGIDGLRVWPTGDRPPQLLGPETIVVAAAGAAAGIARLMGAVAVVPRGATGAPSTDLAAKATAAESAIDGGAERVVVHVGGPDEAAHARDARAKIAALERIDRELVPRLAIAVARAHGELRVLADHGCDPATGEHDGAPVPVLDWRPGATAPAAARARRWCERDVAALEVQALPATVPAAAGAPASGAGTALAA